MRPPAYIVLDAALAVTVSDVPHFLLSSMQRHDIICQDIKTLTADLTFIPMHWLESKDSPHVCVPEKSARFLRSHLLRM
jgi:hypothetical protein